MAPRPERGLDRTRAEGRGFEPSFALVEAKLNAPVPHPSMVSRARLTRLLLAEPSPAVVSVIAPPGYGKTLLLADWAAHETREVAWLTLGDYDNEPSVFLTYVAAALDRLQPIDPSIGQALASQPRTSAGSRSRQAGPAAAPASTSPSRMPSSETRSRSAS